MSSNTQIQNKIQVALSDEQLINITNSCIASQTGLNEIVIGGKVGRNAIINQTNEMENNCRFQQVFKELLKTDQNASLASDLLKSQKSGLFSVSKTNTNVLNKLQTSVSTKATMNVVNTCIQNADVKNKLIIADTAEFDGVINQMNSAFNSCLSNSLTELAKEHGLSGAIDSGITEETSTGFSLFGDLDIKTIAIIVAILILLIIALRKK